MQIPAGESRQGSAERLTDGRWYTRWPVKDLRMKLKSTTRAHARSFYGQWIFVFNVASAPRVPSRFGLRRVLGAGHDLARDLAHMLAGVSELTLQELRLNLHGLLKVGSVDQFPRMLEGGLHIL